MSLDRVVEHFRAAHRAEESATPGYVVCNWVGCHKEIQRRYAAAHVEEHCKVVVCMWMQPDEHNRVCGLRINVHYYKMMEHIKNHIGEWSP